MDINIIESNLSKSIKRQNIDSPNMAENQANSIQKKEKFANEIIMPKVVLPIPMQKDQLQFYLCYFCMSIYQMQLLGIQKNQEIENNVKLLKCQEKRSKIFQKLQKIQEENEYYSDLLCSELNNNSITFEEGSRLNKSLKGQKVKNVQFLSSYYHRKSNFLHHDSKNEKQGCPVLITLENGKSIKVLMNIKDKNSFEVY